MSKKRYHKDEVLFAFALIAPLLIGLCVFYFYPVFQNLFYSFTKWGTFGGYKWTGLDNYKKIMADENVWRAAGNTLKYAFLSVPASILLSLLIANLLNSGIKRIGIYRTIYFLPTVTMTAAIAMVWRTVIFEYNAGIVNYILGVLGLSKVGWLTDPNVAMLTLVIAGVWQALGKLIIIFLAGLQGISKSYYEAAEIDGAGSFQKFIYITVPVLSPTVFFTLITQVISALQVYELIYMMFTADGNLALQKVQSLVYLYYRQAFIVNDKGYAAAIAVLLLGITLIFTVVNFVMQKKWVHY